MQGIRTLKAVLILAFLSFFLSFAGTAKALGVVINEIAWMGTQTSYNNEWIELYNNSDSPISLEGWVFKTADGDLEINLAKVVSANDYYLLERTDDNSVPGVPADIIYQGILNNSGENLELYDSSGDLIDSVNCGSGWFAGDNSTKKTMEKKNSLSGSDIGNWGTGQTSDGTPKTRNSLATETESEPQKKSVSAIYPSGVVINEILPSPEGSDAENEWIEIFNQNDFKIDLSGWQIIDTGGKTVVFTLPERTSIEPLDFLVFPRSITKITLNNDGDGLKLLRPDGNVLDDIVYEKARRGQSYNRTIPGHEPSRWAWSSILTPGAKNEITALTSENETYKEGEEPVFEKETKENQNKRELAAINEHIPKESSSPFPLTALAIAISSGIAILIIKRKIKNFDLSEKME